MNEPVTLHAAIASAINVTLGLLNFLGVDQALVGALQVVAAAWILVIFVAFVRSKVTPNGNVKLTQDQYQALVAAGFSPGKQRSDVGGDQ
jgi:hypothetical protein